MPNLAMTPKATAFSHSRFIGQSESHDQADVSGSESAVPLQEQTC